MDSVFLATLTRVPAPSWTGVVLAGMVSVGCGHRERPIDKASTGDTDSEPGPCAEERPPDMSLSCADATFVADDGGLGSYGAVAFPGDVDGDGVDDILLGYGSHGGASSSNDGTAYLFLGPVRGEQRVSAANARLFGYVGAGGALSRAGDVDGDGFDDFFVGSTYETSDIGGEKAGRSYLVGGPVTGEAVLGGIAIAIVEGIHPYGGLGFSMDAVGDVTGDGVADLAISESSTYDNDGSVWVVPETVQGTVASDNVGMELAPLRVDDTDEYHAGTDAVASAGDIDGDGQPDLIVGSLRGAYVLFGPITDDLILGEVGSTFKGRTKAEYAGAFVAGPGDTNGDGYTDVLIGSLSEESSRSSAYLVLGPATTSRSLDDVDAELSSLNALGADSDEVFFFADNMVAPSGDMNDDGQADILVGCSRVPLDPSSKEAAAGMAFVYFGPVSGYRDSASADLSLRGISRLDGAGWSIAGGGDLDSDGRGDILVGTFQRDDEPRGEAYLVLGSVFGAR